MNAGARVRPTSAPVHRAEALTSAWRLEASCRPQLGVDPAIFFPTQGQSVERAKEICADCPVRMPCLEYALTAGEDDGVWGGLDEDQRRRLKKNRCRCALPGCTRTVERTYPGQRYCCDAHAVQGRRATKNASRQALRAAARAERERAAG